VACANKKGTEKNMKAQGGGGGDEGGRNQVDCGTQIKRRDSDRWKRGYTRCQEKGVRVVSNREGDATDAKRKGEKVKVPYGEKI